MNRTIKQTSSLHLLDYLSMNEDNGLDVERFEQSCALELGYGPDVFEIEDVFIHFISQIRDELRSRNIIPFYNM